MVEEGGLLHLHHRKLVPKYDQIVFTYNLYNILILISGYEEADCILIQILIVQDKVQSKFIFMHFMEI